MLLNCVWLLEDLCLSIWLPRYVATEEGILEYTVNIRERKTFPGITLQ